MLNTSPGLDEITAVDIQQAASDADLLGIWISDYLGGLAGSGPQMDQAAHALARDTAVVYVRCGRPGPSADTTPAQPDVPTTTSIAQPTAPPSEQPGFASALAVWKQTQHVWRGHCRSFLLRAADDLRAAANSRYSTAIGVLTNLASIPLTGVTAAQSNQGYADVQALNRFFGTPGLITCL
jgi:hypothetical protein